MQAERLGSVQKGQALEGLSCQTHGPLFYSLIGGDP